MKVKRDVFIAKGDDQRPAPWNGSHLMKKDIYFIVSCVLEIFKRTLLLVKIKQNTLLQEYEKSKGYKKLAQWSHSRNIFWKTLN